MEGANQLMMQWVGAGTSPVDWCEDNYTVTPHIAEFVNTFSNILFLVVPAASSKLWSSYARQVSRGIHVVWIFFTVIGLSSAYFHATLSLLGQLLDELSILWVLMVSYMLFTPQHFRPSYLCDNPQRYSAVIILLAIIITASAFVQPAINAYALFLVGGPAVAMLVSEVRACKEPSVSQLGHITLGALAVAGTAWVGDRFLCAVWKAMNLTVLHGVWHIFIFIGAYATQVLMCYFHAAQEVPESKPSLRYWPNGKWLGLPYVYCKADKHDKTP